MDSDIKLLSEIYNSAINAISVISSLPDCLADGDFFNTLFDEMTEYRKIANTALTLLEQIGFDRLVPLNTTEKISLWTAKQITKSCTTPRHAASIIISGSTEGIRELITCINVCTDAHKDAMRLAFKLIETEEKNIANAKRIGVAPTLSEKKI